MKLFRVCCRVWGLGFGVSVLGLGFGVWGLVFWGFTLTRYYWAVLRGL